MWDELLDQGFHVAGTGGSDNHWRSTTSVQGVGQPTTWVCVDLEQRNWQGIVDGVRANRTSISSQPPAYQGPRVFLYADDVAGEEGDDFESMIGDTVSPGSSVRVEVENAGGAMVRLVTNQEEPDPEHPTEDRTLATASVDSFAYSHDFEVPDWVHWLRVEVYYEDGREVRGGLRDLCNGFEEGSGQNTVYCDNRLVVVGMTSPIYFQTPEPEFDPATTLTYDGSTTVKVGSTATLAATLLDSAGAPLVNQPVRFTFRDKVYEATTDVAGHASVPVKVAGSPGTYDVISDFAGTDTYSASQDRDVLTVTSGSHK
jgi:hypothetical protein